MKMRNGMYLFAAAIVASTVGLSSCSNDEEGVGGTDWKNGPTKDVTLSLSVKKVLSVLLLMKQIRVTLFKKSKTFGLCQWLVTSICSRFRWETLLLPMHLLI